MSDDADPREFSVDLNPILDALEILICQSDAAEVPADLVERVLKNMGIVKDAAALDPRAPSVLEFYRHLGVCATVCLTRRMAAQKIAARTVSAARKGGT